MTKEEPGRSEAMNLSELPPANCFIVDDSCRSEHPMAVVMDAMLAEDEWSYARVQLALPLGCLFSLFLVRGYPKGDEVPAMQAFVVVCREVAQALADNLDDGQILEFPIKPPRRSE